MRVDLHERAPAPVAPWARRRLAAALLLAAVAVLAPGGLRGQPPTPVSVELRDAGPGEAGRLLREVLARPHHLVVRDTGTLHLPRDTAFGTSVVVVGGDATVAARVEGDVVVIGGDLFLRPGAAVRGRAIAFGGGVYGSSLATVDGGLVAFRDLTFRAERRGPVLTLAYESLVQRREAALVWPGLYGVRIPDYTRVDGLALTVGPRLAVGDGRLSLDPRVTYRSHLGTVDPALALTVGIGRRSELEVVAERGTYTNDAWARRDLVNAAATLVFGDDERNYYRATRLGAAAKRRWEGSGGFVEPWVAAQTEDARSVGPVPGAVSAPWAVRGRRDVTGMLRPNPAVDEGRITSVLVGASSEWEAGDMLSRGHARLEVPVRAPGNGRFAQITLDAATDFATVLDHRLELATHLVATLGDSAPRQRFAYLGGGSTIPTVPELAMGGDQLVLVEGTYLVPLPRPVLPLLGPPTLGVRYLVGAAGVEELPAFVQNVGLRVVLSLLRVDLLVDPASGRRAIGLGILLP